MTKFTLAQEAKLASALERLKPTLVTRAYELVDQTGISRNRDFGKRQMSYLLSVAAAEPPEVLEAWIKGQIGKAGASDGWRTEFGERALGEIDEIKKLAHEEIRKPDGWPSNQVPNDADNELWRRGLTQLFGFARWQMTYLQTRDDPTKRTREERWRQRGGRRP
jgi:hypothetical protein